MKEEIVEIVEGEVQDRRDRRVIRINIAIFILFTEWGYPFMIP